MTLTSSPAFTMHFVQQNVAFCCPGCSLPSADIQTLPLHLCLCLQSLQHLCHLWDSLGYKEYFPGMLVFF